MDLKIIIIICMIIIILLIIIMIIYFSTKEPIPIPTTAPKRTFPFKASPSDDSSDYLKNFMPIRVTNSINSNQITNSSGFAEPITIVETRRQTQQQLQDNSSTFRSSVTQRQTQRSVVYT